MSANSDPGSFAAAMPGAERRSSRGARSSWIPPPAGDGLASTPHKASAHASDNVRRSVPALQDHPWTKGARNDHRRRPDVHPRSRSHSWGLLRRRARRHTRFIIIIALASRHGLDHAFRTVVAHPHPRLDIV